MRLNLNKLFNEVETMRMYRIEYLLNPLPKKWAQRVITKSKKKSLKLCNKNNKILYLCRECKGSGFEYFLDDDYITFKRCKRCDSKGVLSWVDQMIGGWKSSV